MACDKHKDIIWQQNDMCEREANDGLSPDTIFICLYFMELTGRLCIEALYGRMGYVIFLTQTEVFADEILIHKLLLFL